MSEFNQARREGKVKFGYDFNTLAEVTHLWGLSATKLPYHNSFKIPGREDAICLLLSERGGDGWSNIPHRGLKLDGRGWSEIVRIDEFNSNPSKSAQRVAEELAKPLERYVFWREERDGVKWYKFYGVYRLDVAETTASQAVGENVCIYRKVSDEGVCPKCEASTRTITSSEFLAYEGNILEANLLDEVSYEVADAENHSGTVNVWPGQKFLVTTVSPTAITAICKTKNGSVLSQVRHEGEVCFTIPKRDIELGYFKILPDEGTIEDTKEEALNDNPSDDEPVENYAIKANKGYAGRSAADDLFSGLIDIDKLFS